MRRILTEYFSLLNKLTGAKLFSFISGLIYLTFVNCVILKGIGMLTQGWLSFMSIIVRFLSFPFYFVTFFLIMGVTFWIIPPFKTIAKDGKKNTNHTTLLLYTLFGALLFAYMQFGDFFFA
jgi:hypothetical protein